MAADPCMRCGWPVRPDPQAAGFWVDQWNGRYCGGDPRYPHHAAAAKKTNTALIVTGCVAGIVILVAAAVLAAVVARGAGGGPAVARAERSQPATPTASARSGEKTADPGSPEAPVPCEERRLRAPHCFPMPGPEFLAQIGKTPKWRCYESGDKDATGYRIRDPECQTRNESNSRSASIGYRTRFGKDGPAMEKVFITASARALNGGVTAREATELGTDMFETAVAHLWPRDKALQREAREALAKLRKGCREPDLDRHSAKLSAGYEISCSNLTPITIRHDDGRQVTTITDVLNITVPFDHGWD